MRATIYKFLSLILRRREDRILTGFEEIDRTSTILKRGELTVLGGRPSMGKSAFAAHVAAANIEQSSNRVWIYSIERERASILTDIELAKPGVVNTHGHKLSVNDESYLTLQGINSDLRGDTNSAPRPDLVIVDYVQLLENDSVKGTRAETVATLGLGLRALAKRYNVAVLALSQVNQSVDARANHWPRIDDIRESSQIGRDADHVLFLYRESYYNGRRFSDSELIVAKSNYSQVSHFRIQWNEREMRFRPSPVE